MENMFFDETENIRIQMGGNLPHWYQEGKMHFVTFRLADSLPVKIREELTASDAFFRILNPEPWDADTERRYRHIVGHALEGALNKGYGSCVFSDGHIRGMVVETLEYGNGKDYNLSSYVVMPNHVHLLIQPSGNKTLGAILHSIKSFSSNIINRAIGQSGKLWQRESYDRIVRGEEEYKFYRAYIKGNPVGLSPDAYTLYM